MKHLKTIVAALMAAVMLAAVPATAFAPVVFVVCRKFDATNNCHKCSDYFGVQKESEAVARCEKMGYDESYYFPNVPAIALWVMGNCDCK